MAPMTKKITDPSIGSFSGAANPNAIFLAIISDGSSKPSWAHKNGKTRSCGIFLISSTAGSPDMTTFNWNRGRIAKLVKNTLILCHENDWKQEIFNY